MLSVRFRLCNKSQGQRGTRVASSVAPILRTGVTAGFGLVIEGPVADAKCHSWKVSVNCAIIM